MAPPAAASTAPFLVVCCLVSTVAQPGQASTATRTGPAAQTAMCAQAAAPTTTQDQSLAALAVAQPGQASTAARAGPAAQTAMCAQAAAPPTTQDQILAATSAAAAAKPQAQEAAGSLPRLPAAAAALAAAVAHRRRRRVPIHRSAALAASVAQRRLGQGGRSERDLESPSPTNGESCTACRRKPKLFCCECVRPSKLRNGNPS